MHESGIAKDLFSAVCRIAAEKKLRSVTKVRLKVGEASGIDTDFLRHSFGDHVFPGTIASTAKLIIIPEKVRLKCRKCGRTTRTVKMNHPCRCGEDDWEISSGQEVYVASIDGIR